MNWWKHEIKASTKVTGKRWKVSVDAAKRKVREGDLYLIRRHDAWFRPNCHGYTSEIACAGVYDAETARNHLDVEGLSVVPLRAMRLTIHRHMKIAEDAASALRSMLELVAPLPDTTK